MNDTEQAAPVEPLTEARLQEIAVYQQLSQSHHVRDLLAEVDRLKAALAEAREIADRWHGYAGPPEQSGDEQQHLVDRATIATWPKPSGSPPR